MELLQLEHFGKTLRLEGSLAGWQELYWGDNLVSQLSATENLDAKSSHHFELHNNVPRAVEPEEQAQPAMQCQLAIDLTWQPFTIEYQLMIDGRIIDQGSRNSKDIEQQVPIKKPQIKKKFSTVGLLSLGLKLFKSAKLFKVILAGASLAAYSWFFSWQFALSLIACLVFHEYGHIRAMQYFSMKTKGIYLIPFFGGLAVSDDKINTRWQNVVISIMGPTFGLFLSIACLLLYWSTDITFFAGLAVFNSLLNLFNLLPILPLDGGHILKSISFSINSKLGLVACMLAAALGVFISYSLGLALLGFLLIIGSVEIIMEWRGRHQSHLLPLDRYGQIFSTVWYLLTVGILVAIIMYFADSPEEILALPMKILGS
ncbi:site-2 protease family protein [Psychromonas ingrahamii]|uniref:site-2 protease family protein n=1 Tax=Psychromonas ingrahamii TaxID=357794 RepID=UPI0002E5748B|nr:site-2 protease family protein [Psychromonas ingrahamii]